MIRAVNSISQVIFDQPIKLRAVRAAVDVDSLTVIEFMRIGG